MSDAAITAICGVVIALIGAINTWLTIKAGQASQRAETASKANSAALVNVEKKTEKAVSLSEKAVEETQTGNSLVAEVKKVATAAVEETKAGNATLEKVHQAVNGGPEGMIAKVAELKQYVADATQAATEAERARHAESISSRLTQIHDTLMRQALDLKTENAELRRAVKGDAV